MSRHGADVPAAPGRPRRQAESGSNVVDSLDAAGRARIAVLRAQGRFFWLDASLADTDREELVRTLDLPERVLESVPEPTGPQVSRTVRADGVLVAFTLRCYLDAGAPADEDGYRLRALDVFVAVTDAYLLTLHDERISLPATLAPDLPAARGRGYVVYSVLDAMLESTLDALDEVELSMDALVGALEAGGGRVSKGTLRRAGLRLANMRRSVTAEQTVFERIEIEIEALSGFGEDDERYFDRLDDQVARLLTSIDAAASGMGTLLDLQLNERAYVLSIVATIFVPLTFITGFFGMNFGWMVDRIDGETAFWLLGFLPIVAAILSWRLFARRLLPGGGSTSG